MKQKCGKEKILRCFHIIKDKCPHHSPILPPLCVSKGQEPIPGARQGTEMRRRRSFGGHVLCTKATAADVFQPRGNVGPVCPELPSVLNEKLEIWLLL